MICPGRAASTAAWMVEWSAGTCRNAGTPGGTGERPIGSVGAEPGPTGGCGEVPARPARSTRANERQDTSQRGCEPIRRAVIRWSIGLLTISDLKLVESEASASLPVLRRGAYLDLDAAQGR